MGERHTPLPGGRAPEDSLARFRPPVRRWFERALGEPIESFFDRAGEEEFRRREEELVLDLLARPDVRVAALGGGALGSIRVRDALRAHVVVHLEVDRDVAWRRASGRGRPLARDRAKFEALHASRLPVYEAAADATLPAADKALAARARESTITRRGSRATPK